MYPNEDTQTSLNGKYYERNDSIVQKAIYGVVETAQALCCIEYVYENTFFVASLIFLANPIANPIKSQSHKIDGIVKMWIRLMLRTNIFELF